MPPWSPEQPGRGQGGSIEVRVVDVDGAPIVGAEVTLSLPGEEAERGVLRTDVEGRATHGEAPVGEGWAHVRAAGHAGRSRGFSVRQGEGARLEIELARTVRVAGRVLLPDGGPAVGAVVGVSPGGSAEGRSVLVGDPAPPKPRATADGDGAFELELEPGELVTLVGSRAPHAPGCLALVPRAARSDVTLRLEPGGEVRGRVLDPSGRPEAGARVFLVPEDQPFLRGNPRAVVGPGGSFAYGPLDEDVLFSSEVEVEGAIHRAWRATADDDGRFHLGGLPAPGRYRVLAEGGGDARGGVARGGGDLVVLEGPDARAAVDVRLEPRPTLVVHVVGTDGQPVGARCVLRGAREHFLEPRCALEDDEGGLEGRTEAPSASEPPSVRVAGLVGGDYLLEVHPTGHVPTRLSVRVGPQGETRVDVRVQRGRTLDVVLVDPAGRAVAGALVHLHLPAPPDGVEQALDVQADLAGRARFEGVQAGPGQVSVSSEEHLSVPQQAVAAEARELRIVLLPKPRLRFRLRLEGVSLTHDYVWVAEHGASGCVQRTATRLADGRFERVVQRVDEASLFVLLPWEGARVVLGRHRLGPGEVHDLGEVRVDRGRVVDGSVRDPGGVGVAGVTVRATLPDVDDSDDDFGGRTPSAVTTRGALPAARSHQGPVVLRAGHPSWAPAWVPHGPARR